MQIIHSTSVLRPDNWAEKYGHHGDDFVRVRDYRGIDVSYGYCVRVARKDSPIIVQCTEDAIGTSAMNLFDLRKSHLDAFGQAVRDGGHEVRNRMEQTS